MVGQAKLGDRVKIQVTGRLENGTVFGSTRDDEFLEVTVGEGKLIPGLEKAIGGMETGSQKTEKVEAEQAFGPYTEALVMKINRNVLRVRLQTSRT